MDGKTLKTTELNEKSYLSDRVKGKLGVNGYLFVQGLDASPILVANKNSRDGSNGGWLQAAVM
ncbi:hypothetical protein OK016_11130 [Vibrio chagasii]|nr:hypothetical protein [Vibrio chagasii]